MAMRSVAREEFRFRKTVADCKVPVRVQPTTASGGHPRTEGSRERSVLPILRGGKVRIPDSSQVFGNPTL